VTSPRDATFVVFGDDWGRKVSTIQHLFRQLVDHVDVIWIDSIGHREPGVADLPRAWEKARALLGHRHDRPPERSQTNARPRSVVAPRVLPWHSRQAFYRANVWSLTRDIRRALHGRRASDVVLVTNSPPSAGVVGRLGERASIYFCMDDYLNLPGTTPGMLAPLEQALLGRVDAVVATAARLLETKRCRSGRGYHLPQGVNFEHFNVRREIPLELRHLPRPIIGFAGGIGSGVDASVLRAIATANVHGSVVLVGPVQRPAHELIPPGATNVHILGPRSYEDLPAYVQAFDVGIIPYVDNDWMRAVDPLKLLEYLAAGIAVVASPLPEVAKYRDVVRIAQLGDEFVHSTMVAAATATRTQIDRGLRVAESNTWAHRAARFMEIVDEVSAAAGAARSQVRPAPHPAAV
jgi:glycosyltransferase involved in cell wall biosynthesis